jgi:hypothetical protein
MVPSSKKFLEPPMVRVRDKSAAHTEGEKNKEIK